MDSVSLVSAWMWAFVTLVVFFLIAVVIANSIPYKPSDPGTTKRRVSMWILCVLTGVVSFLINFAIAHNIEVPSQYSSYLTHAGIAAAVSILVFLGAAFLASKLFSNSKIGTWF